MVIETRSFLGKKARILDRLDAIEAVLVESCRSSESLGRKALMQ